MRISVDWLNDYIDVKNVDLINLTEKMTLVGNEVESVSKISEATNLVIGYVKEREKHPQADKLSVCLVDIGERELKQIICGAPNVDQGQKVVVAKIGATLPKDITIDKVNIRGVDSEGMICSLEELGIESKYLSEEDKKGIIVLPEDAPIGKDAIKYLGFDDIVINYDLTPNRSDLLSILGMAYEIGAIINKQVVLPDSIVDEINEDIKHHLSLKVDTNNCPLYIARMVKDIEIKDSPAFIKRRLMAAGIRSINNVVDISNYVMLEYGQPLHFFDYDKLGNKIGVRMARDNEEVTTLDDEQRILSKDDIVITNGEDIVAVAGVMGALNTEVDNDTKTIVIESAIFNPLNIRNTSKKIFRSEASIRFEKGIDATRTLEALNRACHLLTKYASGKTLTGTVIHNNIKLEPKVINIDHERINNVLGMDISIKEVSDVFDHLRFDFEQINGLFHVSVPNRRLDINIPEDLIEEVGRIHGYDNMEGLLPTTIIKVGTYSNQYLKRKKINNKLQSLGLKQIVTYSLVSKDMVSSFTNDNFEQIAVINPMSEDKKILRYSLLPSLLKVVEYNLARHINDIAIYEIGSSYYKQENKYIEEEKIAGMLVGNYLINSWENKEIEINFYLIKGLLDNLFNYLGLSNRIKYIKTDNIPSEFHIGRTAEIHIDNEFIGYLGCINPSINKLPIYMFELSLTKLNKYKIDAIIVKDIPKYPSIIKDLAFILDNNILASDILDNIYQMGSSLLTNVEIFDVYTDETLGNNKKSVAFSLEFNDLTKTLTDDEVKPHLDNIIKMMADKYQAILRDK